LLLLKTSWNRDGGKCTHAMHQDEVCLDRAEQLTMHGRKVDMNNIGLDFPPEVSVKSCVQF
jgi:hypothetical protein